MAYQQFTDETGIIAALPDDPNDSGGLSADDLKDKFDENALNIKTYLNDTLVAQLNSTTSGSSGADNLGYGGSIAADTVKEALDLIYAGGSGTIPPDNTITTAKIVDGAVTADKLDSDLEIPDIVEAHSSCYYEMVTASKTFTVPYTGKYLVTLVGGGWQGNNTNLAKSGGVARKMMYLTKDSTVSITIAAAEGTTTWGSVFSATGSSASTTGTGIGGDLNLTANSVSISPGTDANPPAALPPLGYGVLSVGISLSYHSFSATGWGCGGRDSSASTRAGCCEIIGL